jgi:hypothetical protein
MNRDCDAALAGGVNVISSPEVRSAYTIILIFLLTAKFVEFADVHRSGQGALSYLFRTV